MRKNEMVTIQMTKDEAKEISKAMMAAIDQIDEMHECLDNIFDLLYPIISFADNEDPFEKECSEEEVSPEDPCRDCDESCDHNLNQKDAPDTEEESEAEALAIELLKAVFAVLSDTISSGE